MARTVVTNRRIRIYRSTTPGYGAQWHIFGLLPTTSLAMMGNGDFSVWTENVEQYCIDLPGWEMVYGEGDAS